jgi:hypothetical protein
MANTENPAWVHEVNGIVDTKLEDAMAVFKEREMKPKFDRIDEKFENIDERFDLFKETLIDIKENTRRSADANERYVENQHMQHKEVQDQIKTQGQQIEILMQTTPAAIAADNAAKTAEEKAHRKKVFWNWVYGGGAFTLFFSIISWLATLLFK